MFKQKLSARNLKFVPRLFQFKKNDNYYIQKSIVDFLQIQKQIGTTAI